MARPEHPAGSPARPPGPQPPAGITPSAPLDAEIRLPPSKSLTQRALVCAALAAGPSRLATPLESGDTLHLLTALRGLGGRIESSGDAWLVEGFPSLFPSPGGVLDVGSNGTAMRFLIPLTALGKGSWTLDGSERLRLRPVGDLLAALAPLGVEVRSSRGDGFPPVEVRATGLPGGSISVRGEISSQFLSGLLLAAPRARGELRIEVHGPLVSRPYVGLTLEVMRRFGATVLVEGWDEAPAPARVRGPGPLTFRVQPAGYRPADFAVEGDASSACWWFAAAAVTGGRVRVRSIPPGSAQGDLGFLRLLEEMGCRVVRPAGPGDDSIDLEAGSLRGVDADLSDMPDVAPALAAVALFASSPTRIRGAAHLRLKESDRIAGIAALAGSLGALAEEHRDGLTIRPGPLRGATIDPLDDHRLAMAGAVAGLAIPGVRILDPGCVRKSYPGFFEELARVSRPRK